MLEPPASPSPPFDTRTSWQVPSTVGPFAYVKNEVYPLAEHGVSYTYVLEGGTATGTVYVYDFGMKNLPSDVKSEVAVQAFSEVLRGIVQSCSTPDRQLIEMPTNAEVRVDSETGLEYLFHHHLLIDHGSRTGSISTLTTFNRHYIKVRLSYQAEQPMARQLSEAFVFVIHRLLFTSKQG